MIALVSLIFAASVLVTTEKPARCFDWALIANLKSQTLINAELSGPDMVTSDALFRWKIEPRQIVIGQGVPRRFNLDVVAHTRFTPQAARRVVLFVRKYPTGELTLVQRGFLDRRSLPQAWGEEVLAMASRDDLGQCNEVR